jgi:putative ABC transport system substrate-binding protein
MNRRKLVTAVGGVVLWPLLAQAQRVEKVKRIGFLRVGPPPTPWIEGLRQGLRDHGLVEGQNIAIDFGLAQNAVEVRGVAAGLVQRKVDVLFASGTPSLLPAMETAGTIPVVFVASVDFAGPGRLMASVARPGGNVTGISAMLADTIGKRLQLLKEVLPNLSKVAILVRTGSPATQQFVQEAERATRTLRLELQVVELRNQTELGALVGKTGSDALLLADDAVFTANRKQIGELALKHRLPTIFGFSDMPKAGGLMSYGPHYGRLYRRAASYVHKILNGANPSDLPIEQATEFELVINLRTAKALGVTIPPAVLARADEIIE